MSGSRAPQAGRGRVQGSGRIKALGIAATIVALLVLGVWQGWSRFHRERPQSASAKSMPFSMGKPLDVTPASASTNLMAAPPKKPDEVVLKPTAPVFAPPKVQPMGSWQDTATDPQKPQKSAAPAPTATADPDVVTPGAAQSEYAQRMQTTPVSNITPVLHGFHNEYTIKKGWKIPCVPDVPISSELPGPVTCITTEEVRSLDRSTVLLPRYTQINGQIERGLNNGDQRLFLVWTDALTPAPDLLPIPLGGMPAADEAGQIGVPGDLNTHLWQKLKATAFLTAIQTVGSVAVAASQNGSRNNYFGPVGSAGNGLAEQALAKDLDIPTTLYRGANQPLIVYVNKYVDLVNFYKNVPVKRNYRGSTQ